MRKGRIAVPNLDGPLMGGTFRKTIEPRPASLPYQCSEITEKRGPPLDDTELKRVDAPGVLTYLRSTDHDVDSSRTSLGTSPAEPRLLLPGTTSEHPRKQPRKQPSNPLRKRRAPLDRPRFLTGQRPRRTRAAVA